MSSFVSKLNLSSNGSENTSSISCDGGNSLKLNANNVVFDTGGVFVNQSPLYFAQAGGASTAVSMVNDALTVSNGYPLNAYDFVSSSGGLVALWAQEASDVATLTSNLTNFENLINAQLSADEAVIALKADESSVSSRFADAYTAISLKADESSVVSRCNDLGARIDSVGARIDGVVAQEASDVANINAALLNAEQQAAATFASLQSQIDALTTQISSLSGSYYNLTHN